jgi:hypothetical protein
MGLGLGGIWAGLRPGGLKVGAALADPSPAVDGD